MGRFAGAIGVLLLLQVWSLTAGPSEVRAQTPLAEAPWVTWDAAGKPQIHLYFFWSLRCPYCKDALPFIETMARFYPWLTVHSHELVNEPEKAQLYIRLAERIGRRAESVPGFLFCGEMHVGYVTDRTTGAFLQRRLQACYEEHLLASTRQPPHEAPRPPEDDSEPVEESGAVEVIPDAAGAPEAPAAETAGAHETPAAETAGAPEVPAAGTADADAARAESARADGVAAIAPVVVPVLGEIAPAGYSLPVFTLIIAGLDAFNPCAFFVLLFLLSLLIRVQRRARMIVIGGIFVFFSGFIYFVFMAAWLNVFLLLGELRMITLVAGGLAVTMALINVKDYFFFKKGVSLSIPEHARPGMHQRMRKLIQAGSWPAMIVATVSLAVATNAYELLCTAGFPMVYTRVLTLADLPTSAYYLYLVLYNVIYVVPLALIVVAFTVTMNARRMTEREGRLLKLLSGAMMLGLGLLLITAPQALSNVAVAGGLLVLAVTVTALAVITEKLLRKRATV